jgi:hypothetical protein
MMIDDLFRAMTLMRRRDAHLIQVNGKRGPEWWIAPNGGRVDPRTAEQIRAHSQVKGDEDGLWPGLSQTWRMR